MSQKRATHQQITAVQGGFHSNASPTASPKQKGLTAEATSPCFKWSGREDLNLRPPAPKAGTLARLPTTASSTNKLCRRCPLFIKISENFLSRQARATMLTDGTIHPTRHGGIRGGPEVLL